MFNRDLEHVSHILFQDQYNCYTISMNRIHYMLNDSYKEEEHNIKILGFI